MWANTGIARGLMTGDLNVPQGPKGSIKLFKRYKCPREMLRGVNSSNYSA